MPTIIKNEMEAGSIDYAFQTIINIQLPFGNVSMIGQDFRTLDTDYNEITEQAFGVDGVFLLTIQSSHSITFDFSNSARTIETYNEDPATQYYCEVLADEIVITISDAEPAPAQAN